MLHGTEIPILQSEMDWIDNSQSNSCLKMFNVETGRMMV